jgi:hypothetical protein
MVKAVEALGMTRPTSLPRVSRPYAPAHPKAIKRKTRQTLIRSMLFSPSGVLTKHSSCRPVYMLVWRLE